MQPRFLAAGEAPPPATLVVDCAAAGGAATYSHWRGAPAAPRELAADTSTAMVVAAAREPARWLAGFTWVANDHIDADGLLAMALACRPELAARHAALLIGAAEAGDFAAWPGAPAFRLMLRLHQLIRTEQAAGGTWQQRCCARVAADLDALIAESAQPDPARDAQVAQVEATRARLAGGDGFRVVRSGRLATIAWQCRLGHAWDAFLGVHQPDDLPICALDGVAPVATWQLLAERSAGGTVYVLDAPRHAWAQTVRRPAVAIPDLARLAGDLQRRESGGCRWVARPAAAQVGFNCHLASCDGQGLALASRLPLETVAAAVEAALA